MSEFQQDITSNSSGIVSPSLASFLQQASQSRNQIKKCFYFGTEDGCRNGDNCRFVHENSVQSRNKYDDKIKTELCKHEKKESGSCRKGTACLFAHTAAELKKREIPEWPPNHSMTWCRDMQHCTKPKGFCFFAHTDGELRRPMCQYGSGCTYINCQYAHRDAEVF